MLWHIDILGFYGQDRRQAWAEAFRLGQVLVARGAADRMSVRAEQRRGEWVVTLIQKATGGPG